MDGNFLIANGHGVDAELGFFVIFTQPIHQVVGGGNSLRKRVLTQWRDGVAINLGGSLCKISERLHQGPLGFIDLIKHGVPV